MAKCLEKRDVFEVVVYSNTCTDERFSCGLFTSEKEAVLAGQAAEETYSNCSYIIEPKTLYDIV